MRRARAASLVLASACSLGCASATVRGIVRDADNRPVPGATLAVEKPGGAAARKPIASETNGCFSFTVRKGAPLVLVVTSPGRRPARSPIGTGGAPILVTLQGSASAEESSVKEIVGSMERRGVFEQPCQPFTESDWIRER